LFAGQAAVRGHNLWPEPASIPASGARTLTLAPGQIVVLAYDRLSDLPLPKRLPLLEKDWELLLADKDGRFPSPAVPEHSMWSCPDAMTIKLANSDRIDLMTFDEQGKITPRTGVTPTLTGAKTEGIGLPRQRLEQPFALLKKLPHRCFSEGTLGIVCGGNAFFLGVLFPVPGEKPRFETAGPGVFVSAVIEPENPIGAEAVFHADADAFHRWLQTRLDQPLAANQAICVGFASLDDACLAEAQRLSAAYGIPAEPMLTACRDLTRTPTMANLSRLNLALKQWFDSAAPCPALFAPGQPGAEIFHRVQALTLPLSPADLVALLPDHDWLAPGIGKTVRTGLPGRPGHRGGLSFSAMADVPREALALEPLPAGDGVKVLLHDQRHVERLLPLAVWNRVAVAGHEFLPADLTWLEVNRPYELQTQSLPVTLVTEREADAGVNLRNWSPYYVDITTTVQAPAGWKVAVNPPRLRVPPLSDRKVELAVAAPANARGGEYRLKLATNHLEDETAACLGIIKVNLIENLSPVVGTRPPAAAAALQLRRFNMFACHARKNENVVLNLENRRVTTYTDTMTWRLLDAALQPVQKQQLAVDQSFQLAFTPPDQGALYLEVDAKNGSAIVTSETHALSEAASATTPLNLFNTPLTRYFYVPGQAQDFFFAARDGGPDETAEVLITSPTGRVALSRNGNWAAENNRIEVRTGEDAGVWSIICRPVQDVTIWLGGDVSPWLAPAPDTVLKGRP
ncbi:MAG: hypothetical protein PHC30_06025, partial [Lentisphaeria bacterium]|nr:hypothetical protein [Lentisphaeria bacterium]